MTATARWNRVVRRVGVDPIGTDLLRGLVDGQISVVALKGLLPSEVFSQHRERLARLFDRASTTQYVNGTLTTIGPYLAKYLSNVDEYFREAKEANSLTSEISFTLADEVRAGLAEVFSMRRFYVAEEPDGRRYADSVVRIHADGVRNPLHNDNIMRDAAGTNLVVSNLLYQLSCVVCVQECATGGELKTYAKPWQPADEQFKILGGLGYEYGVVESVPSHEFKPQTEDVYLINPTYFHEIAEVGGSDRLTLGFFFGFAEQQLDNAIAWG
ncbi:MAG: hypothetical protein ACRDRU_01275 [Pseudonocardiaceae bacterium]